MSEIAMRAGARTRAASILDGGKLPGSLGAWLHADLFHADGARHLQSRTIGSSPWRNPVFLDRYSSSHRPGWWPRARFWRIATGACWALPSSRRWRSSLSPSHRCASPRPKCRDSPPVSPIRYGLSMGQHQQRAVDRGAFHPCHRQAAGTETHKRLILLLTISMLGPRSRAGSRRFSPRHPVPRPIPGFPVINLPPVSFTVAPALVGDLMLLVAILFDWRSNGRVHPVYWIGGAVMLLLQVTVVPVSEFGALADHRSSRSVTWRDSA